MENEWVRSEYGMTRGARCTAYVSPYNSDWIVRNGTSRDSRTRSRLALSHIIRVMGYRDFSLLDIGCGAGTLVNMASGLGIEAYGYDKCTESISYAKLHHVGTYMSDLSQFNSQVNVISMVHVLEHIHNPIEYLAEIRNRLTNDGLLYIAVPNLGSFNSVLGRWYESTLFDPDHLTAFHQKGLEDTMRSAGYRIVVSGKKMYPGNLLAQGMSWVYQSIRKSKSTGQPTFGTAHSSFFGNAFDLLDAVSPHHFGQADRGHNELVVIGRKG